MKVIRYCTFSPSYMAHLRYLINAVYLALLAEHLKFVGFKFQSMWKVSESRGILVSCLHFFSFY